MKKAILVFLMAFLILSNAKLVMADDQVRSISDTVQVLPPKFEMWANPGDKLTEYLRITNEADEPALIALTLDDFSITADGGSVVLGQNFSLPNQLRDWISFDQKAFQLQAKETKIVSYKINIPDNAYAGGNYAAIVVSTDKLNRKEGEQPAIAKVVSMVLLSVTGAINDSVQIRKYSQFKDTSSSGEVTHNFSLNIKNIGNNHIQPRGVIVISNFFGRKIDEVPLDTENVLPNVSRIITTKWKPGKMLFGRYNATLIAVYGYTSDKKINENTHFYAFSPLAVVIFIFILLVLAFAFSFYKRRRKLKKDSSSAAQPNSESLDEIDEQVEQEEQE